MSRAYGMSATIIFNSKSEMPTPEDKARLEDAVHDIWSQEGNMWEGVWTDDPRDPDSPTFPTLITEYSEGRLCGGESEEEFAAHLTQAVWTHLGRYVRVQVDMTYLEDLPFEVHTSDEDDYADWVAENT